MPLSPPLGEHTCLLKNTEIQIIQTVLQVISTLTHMGTYVEIRLYTNVHHSITL